MRGIKNRVLACLLVCAMVFSMLSFNAQAEENGHVHNWDFEVMDDIWANCYSCDSYVELGVSPYGPKIEIKSDEWLEQGLTISEIWYQGIDVTVYEKSKVVPTIPGKYKVTIKAEGMTLEKECVITDDCKNNNHEWNVTLEEQEYSGRWMNIKCKNQKCSLSFKNIEMYFYATEEEFGLNIHGVEKDPEVYLKEIGLNNFSIVYEGISPTIYEKTKTKPTKVGKYKATIMIEDKVVVEEFKITQDCKKGEHKWHGEVEAEDDRGYTDVGMSCLNEYCSYNCYNKHWIYIKDFYNEAEVFFDETCEELGIERPKLRYESVAPVAGKITDEFPAEVGDYKVTVYFEDVVCEKDLKITTTCGKSYWEEPYGRVSSYYIENKNAALGLTDSQIKTLNNGDYYTMLNVKNVDSTVDTNDKLKISEKLGNNEKAIFCNMDFYACALKEEASDQPIIELEYVGDYFDFTKMVPIYNTKKEIEVCFCVNEFILRKYDFSNNNLKVLRSHNGNVKVLDTEIKTGTFNEGSSVVTDGPYNYIDKTRIYFKTDKFSADTTYALVYTETKEDTICKCPLLIEIEGVEATCTEDGTKTYYKCISCDKKYADEQASQELQEADLVEKAKGHSTTKVEEKKATCTEEGTKEYYKCTECNKKFEDAAGKKEIQEPVKIAKGHNMIFMQEKKATCTEDGTKAHYTCSKCNKKFEDAEGKKELKDADIVIKSANGVHKEVVIPGYGATCCAPGLTDGKKCSECGDILEAQKTIEKTAHVLLYIPGEPATYTSDGHRSYYECYMCRGMYADAYGYVETNHNLIKLNKLQVGAPKSIKAKTRKSSSITVTWSKVSGASGYAVFVAKKGKWVQLATTAGTSYTAKKLSAGTNYTYAVMAYKKVNGKAVWSNSYKQATLKTLPGKTSKISSKSAGKGKVTLSWNKVKGASGYRLYYKQGKKWVTLKSSMSGNKIKVTGLKVGKKYTFAVKAYVKENGKTVWSDVYTSKTVTAPKK